MEALALQYRGQTLELALPDGVDTTVGQMQDAIARETGVAQDAQRLFHSKRRLDVSNPHQLLVDVCPGLLEVPALLLLAGATREAIQAMNETQSAVAQEQQIRTNRPVVSIAQRNSAFQAQAAAASSYRFHNIEVLHNFRDADKARDILNQLANDRGILAVMEKHKWSVGTLAEMYPDGKVGVDPVCVLGLNENKGQKILLRLRTDDLLGFRKYLSIKKVLFHELSHNVHSEHDSKFYQLMRQVERECDELDWTHSTGASVGGNSARIADEGSAVDNAPRGHKLGGGSSRRTSRLLEDRPQAPMTIGSTPSTTQSTANQMARIDAEVASVSVHRGDQVNNTMGQAAQPASRSGSPGEPIPTSTPTETTQPPSPRLNVLPDALPEFPMSERERRAYAALQALQEHYDARIVSSAVSVLHKIVANIVSHPGEPKYRSIRKANRVFESRVGRLPECLEFLLALGFEDQAESLVLARDDPALLWLGRSTLEVMLPASA